MHVIAIVFAVTCTVYTFNGNINNFNWKFMWNHSSSHCARLTGFRHHLVNDWFFRSVAAAETAFDTPIINFCSPLKWWRFIFAWFRYHDCVTEECFCVWSSVFSIFPTIMTHVACFYLLISNGVGNFNGEKWKVNSHSLRLCLEEIE